MILIENENENEKETMICQKHKQEIICISIKDIPLSQNPYSCVTCITQSSNSGNSFIQLKEILNYQKDDILYNYPPLSNQMKDKVNSFHDYYDQIKQQKDQFFDELKGVSTQYTNFFQDLFKKIDNFFSKIDHKIEELKNTYNEIARVSQLREIISQPNQLEKIDKLNEFIKSQLEKKQSNSNILQKKIKELDSMIGFIRKDRLFLIQEQVKRFMDAFDFLDQNDEQIRDLDIDNSSQFQFLESQSNQNNPIMQQEIQNAKLLNVKEINMKNNNQENLNLQKNNQMVSQLKNELNEKKKNVDILNGLNFIEKNQKDQCLLIQKINDQLQIQCRKSGEGLAYSEQPLIPSQKYIINLEFQPVSPGAKFQIGLVSYHKLKIIEYQTLNSRIQKIEIKIDIQNKVFKLQSGSSKTIKELEFNQQYKNKEYKLAILIKEKRETITITQFQLVDSF